MIYGYARCSTNETKQDVNRQVRELIKLGANKDNIFTEYESGTKINRVELNRLLDTVKIGDTIVATEVSRLTRSTKQLCDLVDLAKDKHLKLVLGSFVVDCTKELDCMTEAMLKVFGVFSELERNMISDRVKSGMENAKAKGKVVGRPKLSKDTLPADFEHYYNMYLSQRDSKDIKNKLTLSDVAKFLKCSRQMLYKYIKIYEAEL